MRKYTVEETTQVVQEKKLTSLRCNKCGQKMMEESEMFSVQHQFGYGSKFDTEYHIFDICERCYEEWIEGFVIPIEVKE